MQVTATWHQACLRVISSSLRPTRQFSTSNHVYYPAPKSRAATPTLPMDDYGLDVIRNFSIIAHIDHGKSTLADRLLELTKTIQLKSSGPSNPSSKAQKNEQVLDKLKVERERGITVKAQTASMFYTHTDQRKYLLNLIDTPGHVDFAWEVSRSLAACQGALLLVDATQGVQAQSISVFHVAKERGLKIIPVLNKIDLPNLTPSLLSRAAQQIETTFSLDPSEILYISAKSGKGVEDILKAVVERIPAPPQPAHVLEGKAPKERLKAFLFDSFYDRYRGVISLVSVQEGTLKRGNKIQSHHTSKKYEITELGIMHPEETPTASLHAGQVGYVACNMKDPSEAHVGDTLFKPGDPVEPMPGFKASKAMVYAGIFPVDSNDFPKLEESIKRLTLTDRSVTVQRDSSAALGQGCRLGFLGTLHMDVFRQRLEDEHDANVIITAPTVPYKVLYNNGTEVYISNPIDFPDTFEKVKEVQEPVVKASIIVPDEYFGEMMDLCYLHRATDLEHRYLDVSSSKQDSSDGSIGSPHATYTGVLKQASSSRIILQCVIPLSEVVTDFFDQLKSRSSGFASFDYEDAGYMQSDLNKMTFLLNGRAVDALALIVHKASQDAVGRTWVKKLHKVIPRQLFEVPIQAAIGKKVIARETLSAYRADVTAGLYGGHQERKQKHLDNQKEGKKRMKKIGNVELPQEAFYDILSSKAKK